MKLQAAGNFSEHLFYRSPLGDCFRWSYILFEYLKTAWKCQKTFAIVKLSNVLLWECAYETYNWEYILSRGIKSKIIFLMISIMEGKNNLFRQAVLLKSTT